jgi:hypothetical protein
MAYIKLAPYNAPSAWKASATLVLPGANDIAAINPYLIPGNQIEFGPGNIVNPKGAGDGIIWLYNKSGILIRGQGPSTIFDIAGFYISNVSQLDLGEFNMIGSVGNDVPYASLFIGGSVNIADINVHDIVTNQTLGQHFYVYANGAIVISNMVFSRCISQSSDYFGFIFNGEKPGPIISDVVLYRCQQFNAGLSGKSNGWVTGFDCAEFGEDQLTSTSRRFTVIKCESNSALESTYHQEGAVNKQDFVYLDCDAKWAGMKPDSQDNGDGTHGSQYGWGFLFSGFKSTDSLITSGLTGDHNKYGDMIDPNGVTHSPPIDGVWGENKVVTRVSKGNCVGIAVKNAGLWDVYLYSSDELAVSQQINLPDGTLFLASFTDFLIQRGISPNPNGLIHGTSHTASYQISISPANQPCQIELWLGPNSSTKSATAGLSSAFNSTGSLQQVTSIVKLPAAGTYNVYVDLYMSGVKIKSFVGLSTVTVI